MLGKVGRFYRKEIIVPAMQQLRVGLLKWSDSRGLNVFGVSDCIGEGVVGVGGSEGGFFDAALPGLLD